MKLLRTPLERVFVVEIEPVTDERGYFARTYCDEEFGALLPHVAQAAVSFNRHKGTFRGMHYQREPHSEAKLVRCTRGAIYDIVADMNSGLWFGVELTQDNHRMLLVPEGFAHGFQSLTDAAEVSYLLSRSYEPAAATGFRWNDPAFDIRLPLDVTVISERDNSWPEFRR